MSHGLGSNQEDFATPVEDILPKQKMRQQFLQQRAAYCNLGKYLLQCKSSSQKSNSCENWIELTFSLGQQTNHFFHCVYCFVISLKVPLKRNFRMWDASTQLNNIYTCKVKKTWKQEKAAFENIIWSAAARIVATTFQVFESLRFKETGRFVSFTADEIVPQWPLV